MTEEEFTRQPFDKQIHQCALAWLRNQHIPPYSEGKLVRTYHQCRGYLRKLDRSTVKNIRLMLDVTEEKVPLCELRKIAAEFAEARIVDRAREKYAGAKEYRIDIEEFLNS